MKKERTQDTGVTRRYVYGIASSFLTIFGKPYKVDHPPCEKLEGREFSYGDYTITDVPVDEQCIIRHRIDIRKKGIGIRKEGNLIYRGFQRKVTTYKKKEIEELVKVIRDKVDKVLPT